jgi:hypothetical protein
VADLSHLNPRNFWRRRIPKTSPYESPNVPKIRLPSGVKTTGECVQQVNRRRRYWSSGNKCSFPFKLAEAIMDVAQRERATTDARSVPGTRDKNPPIAHHFTRIAAPVLNHLADLRRPRG